MSNSENKTFIHHLLIIDEEKERRIVKLTDVAYSIGRDATNAIVLNEQSTSRQHAMLVRVPIPHQGHRYRIIDGNSQGKPSANGIFINGKSYSMRELDTRDIILFGKGVKATYLTLEMGQAELHNYLESLSYKSLKSDAIDTKATIAGLDLPGSDLTAVLVAQSTSTSKHCGSSLQQDTQRAKETVRLSREEILKELNQPVSRQMWMVATGAIFALCALSSWFVLNDRKSNPIIEFAQEASGFAESKSFTVA